MKVLVAVCTVAFALGSTQALAHGEDAHHAVHDDSFGKPGDPDKVSRTVAVDMTDAMRFTPTNITVKKGETIRFAVRNSGQLKHEMVLGTAKEMREHSALMQKFPE